MAKTKRRSCKGGRKSRRCRGGTNDSYKDAYKTPYSASSDERGFRGVNTGVTRLGYDTKQPKRRGPSTADIVNEVERDAKNYMRMRRIRELARGVSASAKNTANRLKDSVLGLPGTLRGSVSDIYKRLTTDPRFEKEKLIPANIETKHNQAGVQNFLRRSNEIYNTNFKKVGQYYDDDHPYFLPGHYDPDKTWNIAEWDPTPKWGGR